MSLQSPGNLVFLATQHQCEILFITTRASEGLIQGHLSNLPLLQSLKISFLWIDDLVNLQNYGLTLSLAYERAIRSDPEDVQLNTYYSFLNGDFALSDNTYTTMVKLIDQGFNSVLCPSLRVNEEYVNPILEEICPSTENTTMTLSARKMMEISLQHLHPTVIASGVDYENYTTHIAHQFFMRVNNDLLIGRFFLLFMLCIRPERPLPLITAFCDYSFIPEMCPSGNYTIITDTDDAYLMELSPKNKDGITVAFGKHYENYVLYKTLGEWVTDHQEHNSKHLILMHSKDLPTSGPEFELLKESINTLDKRLNKVYDYLNAMNIRQTHVNHYYWTDNLGAQQAKGNLLDRPPLEIVLPGSAVGFQIHDTNIEAPRQINSPTPATAPSSTITKISKGLYSRFNAKISSKICNFLVNSNQKVINLTTRIANRLLKAANKHLVNKHSFLCITFLDMQPSIDVLKKSISNNDKVLHTYYRTEAFYYEFRESLNSQLRNNFSSKEISTITETEDFDVLFATIQLNEIHRLIDLIKHLKSFKNKKVIIYLSTSHIDRSIIQDARFSLVPELSVLSSTMRVKNVFASNNYYACINKIFLNRLFNEGTSLFSKLLPYLNYILLVPIIAFRNLRSPFKASEDLFNPDCSSITIELEGIN